MSITIPTKVKIKDDLFKQLKELHSEQVALDQFIQRMLTSGKSQAMAIQEKLREVWAAIAKEHGVDIQNINWAPMPDGTIVPVSVQFNNGPSRQ